MGNVLHPLRKCLSIKEKYSLKTIRKRIVISVKKWFIHLYHYTLSLFSSSGGLRSCYAQHHENMIINNNNNSLHAEVDNT